MAKEVSALNTFWLIQYLEERHPQIDLEEMIDRITSQFPCYVENLQSGRIEPVSLEHLRNPHYWFSHQFVQHIHDQLLAHFRDPRIGYIIGRSIYKTRPLVRTTLGLTLLGVHRVARKVSREAAKFNLTKEYRVTKLEKGYAEIQIVHHPGIVINEFTMQWNAGCFAAYARLAGATNVAVELECVDPGPTVAGEDRRAIWDFLITYREPPLLIRLAKAILSLLPWIRTIIVEAEANEMAHREQIINRDQIIRERTAHLLAIQERLIEEERASIGKKLRQMSMELVTTEERERRAIAEDLHDSVTQLLALGLSQIRAARRRHPDIDEFTTLQNNIEQALSDLRSLTFHISPPVLYDFGLEAALNWLVTDVNARNDMRLVFANLLPAPLNPDQQTKVALYRAVRELVINLIKHAGSRDGQVMLMEADDCLVIEVADEGNGFDPVQVYGKGLGLFSLEDRLLAVEGKIAIDTLPGEGTIVRITVPLARLRTRKEKAMVSVATSS